MRAMNSCSFNGRAPASTRFQSAAPTGPGVICGEHAGLAPGSLLVIVARFLQIPASNLNVSFRITQEPIGIISGVFGVA